MNKPFLLLQIRPEDIASDEEYQAFLRFSGLEKSQLLRWRLDQKPGITEISIDDYAGIIVGGGPACVSTPESEKPAYQVAFEQSLFALMEEIIQSDTPFFGACYGIGVLAKALGGDVSKKQYSEPVGAVKITLRNNLSQEPILKDIPAAFEAFAGHKESVQSIPKSAANLASSETCPIQLLKVKQNIYATQFHPELDVEGIITRIDVYKHAGYFPPEDADALIERCRKSQVTESVKILKNFCDLYR